jgi:hypothetical protein
VKNPISVVLFSMVSFVSGACTAAPILSHAPPPNQIRGPAQNNVAPEYHFATISPASGSQSAFNQTPNKAITQLAFTNNGREAIFIQYLEIKTNRGTIISGTQGPQALGINPGKTVTVVFANNHPVDVRSITFTVGGSADSLEINGIDYSEPVPSGFSSGN